MNTRPILYAEDDENDIRMTLKALKNAKLLNEIVVVRDGEEALDYLYRRGAYATRPPVEPMVLLLDLKMPKVSGIDVLRTIREDAVLRHLPVVILTASREERDLAEGYRLNVNAYVVKPVNFDQFTSAITQIGMFWALLNEPPPAAPWARPAPATSAR